MLRPLALPSLVLIAVACGAVYPELKTPLHQPVAQQPLDPPPGDLKWIAFRGALVPAQTRDGRKWDATGGALPDPFASLIVNGKTILRTPVQSNTLTPTWPDAPHGNFHIASNDHVRIELWDTNPINDHPIGVKDIGSNREDIGEDGVLDLACDSGAHIKLVLEAAHAQVGLGFYYELRSETAYVTRVFDESPAARAGIKAGDQLVTVDGKSPKTLSAGELQSLVNTPHAGGLNLTIRHADKSEVQLTVKEGAVYPLFSEVGSIP